MGRPDDIAKVALFLASDMAGYITAQLAQLWLKAFALSLSNGVLSPILFGAATVLVTQTYQYITTHSFHRPPVTRPGSVMKDQSPATKSPPPLRGDGPRTRGHKSSTENGSSYPARI
jgi:hypothetical protein